MDYFFADSFLDEEFDPSEIYSLNDIQDDNDPDYAIQRNRMHLETLLGLYRLEAARSSLPQPAPSHPSQAQGYFGDQAL